MKKILLLILGIVLLLNLGLVNAATQQELDEVKNLIDSKVDCKNLSDSQLEIIGEYYMEKMHPGESHELMHKMMGLEEGSESEKQFHISMAKSLYCNEDISGGMMGGGMMGMMPMMMNTMGGQVSQTNMMGNSGDGFGYWNFINILYVILLIGLIILVYLLVIKLWKNMKGRGGKK